MIPAKLKSHLDGIFLTLCPGIWFCCRCCFPGYRGLGFPFLFPASYYCYINCCYRGISHSSSNVCSGFQVLTWIFPAGNFSTWRTALTALLPASSALWKNRSQSKHPFLLPSLTPTVTIACLFSLDLCTLIKRCPNLVRLDLRYCFKSKFGIFGLFGDGAGSSAGIKWWCAQSLGADIEWWCAQSLGGSESVSFLLQWQYHAKEWLLSRILSTQLPPTPLAQPVLWYNSWDPTVSMFCVHAGRRQGWHVVVKPIVTNGCPQREHLY